MSAISAYMRNMYTPVPHACRSLWMLCMRMDMSMAIMHAAKTAMQAIDAGVPQCMRVPGWRVRRAANERPPGSEKSWNGRAVFWLLLLLLLAERPMPRSHLKLNAYRMLFARRRNNPPPSLSAESCGGPSPAINRGTAARTVSTRARERGASATRRRDPAPQICAEGGRRPLAGIRHALHCSLYTNTATRSGSLLLASQHPQQLRAPSDPSVRSAAAAPSPRPATKPRHKLEDGLQVHMHMRMHMNMHMHMHACSWRSHMPRMHAGMCM